jgi:hypothetical protein
MLDDPPGETHLIAGPASATPPFGIACVLTGLSVAAPILFLSSGAPGPLLGIAALALAGAGIITMAAAVAAQRRRRADSAVRPRATITREGITLHPSPANPRPRHFGAADIHSASLLPHALVIQTKTNHPEPGRHVLRFGKLDTPREALTAALTSLGTRF